jgi:hypothetical protein
MLYSLDERIAIMDELEESQLIRGRQHTRKERVDIAAVCQKRMRLWMSGRRAEVQRTLQLV